MISKTQVRCQDFENGISLFFRPCEVSLFPTVAACIIFNNIYLSVPNCFRLWQEQGCAPRVRRRSDGQLDPEPSQHPSLQDVRAPRRQWQAQAHRPEYLHPREQRLQKSCGVGEREADVTTKWELARSISSVQTFESERAWIWQRGGWSNSFS